MAAVVAAMKLIVAAAALVATASAYTTPSLHRALQHRRPLAARVVRRQAAGGDESIASPEVESTTVAAAVSDEEDFELFEPAVAPAPTRKPWEVEPGAGAYKGDAGAFLGSASGGGAIQKGGEANGEEDGKQLRVVLYIGLSLAPILFLLPFLSNRELKPLDQVSSPSPVPTSQPRRRCRRRNRRGCPPRQGRAPHHPTPSLTSPRRSCAICHHRTPPMRRVPVACRGLAALTTPRMHRTHPRTHPPATGHDRRDDGGADDADREGGAGQGGRGSLEAVHRRGQWQALLLQCRVGGDVVGAPLIHLGWPRPMHGRQRLLAISPPGVAVFIAAFPMARAFRVPAPHSAELGAGMQVTGPTPDLASWEWA